MNNSFNIAKCIGLIFTFSFLTFAQTPTLTPTDEPIKIFTEEVHLNVSAQNNDGKFVPTLKADDLLIVEEGTPQTITSMKRVPANVLLLLDTGSELNFIKSLKMTRVTAKLFLHSLLPEDTISVMQYYDKIETIADWTQDFNLVSTKLDTKLFSGKRTRFSDALNAAIEQFKTRPLKNRHLVLITDGLENTANESAQINALQNIVAANITVHVLSYTTFEQEQAKKASRRLKLGDGKTKDRVPDEVLESILQMIPEVPGKVSMRETMRSMYKSQGILVFDLDNERRKLIQKKQDDWQKSQEKLKNLAEDTGGIFQAPEEFETMFRLAIRVANAVDSNYIVTYTPTKPIADTKNFEQRKVRVSSHCDGVEIRSRHKVILNSKLP